MKFYFGNLSAKQVARRLSLSLSAEEYQRLDACRIANTTQLHNQSGWHAYSHPLIIVCGSPEVARLWKHVLDPHSSQIKKPLHILQDWDN